MRGDSKEHQPLEGASHPDLPSVAPCSSEKKTKPFVQAPDGKSRRFFPPLLFANRDTP